MPQNNTTSLPGLYVHVPFCASKCPYCNFYSQADRSALPAWISALIREMALYREAFQTYGPFDTLYLGGGTPSTLSPEELSTLLDALYGTFLFTDDCETTMEVNPGDLDVPLLSFLETSPLNRINLGVQSFDDGVLRLLGRRHDGRRSRHSVELLRQRGFTNIGLDLIYGVPGQSMETWIATLDEALRYEPEHLSCYELTLEPDTPLGERYADDSRQLPDEDSRYTLFMTTSEYLERAGYIHYEVSNFARSEDLRSRHNRKYWNHTPYLGLGPSAHSFSGRRRWWNHADLSRYCADLEQNERPLEASETLSDEDLRMERVFLGLRTIEGIDLGDFDPRDRQASEVLERCAREGLLKIRGARATPTLKGLALADQLAVMF